MMCNRRCYCLTITNSLQPIHQEFLLSHNNQHLASYTPGGVIVSQYLTACKLYIRRCYCLTITNILLAIHQEGLLSHNNQQFASYTPEGVIVSQ